MGHAPSKQFNDKQLRRSIQKPKLLKPAGSAPARSQSSFAGDSDDKSLDHHRRTKSASGYTHTLYPDDAPPSYGDTVFPRSDSYSGGSNHLTIPGQTQDSNSRGSNNPFLRAIGSSSSLSASQSNAATPRSFGRHTRRTEQERLEYLRQPLRKESYENALIQLKQYDTVIVVDDSGSMGFHGRWQEARAALARLADVAGDHDDDGFEIQFLNNETVLSNCKNSTSVMRLFDTVRPDGITPIGERLNAILNTYLDQLDHAKKNKKPLPKRLNILVLTDGAPTDDPQSVIAYAAKRLDKDNYPLSQVGIQFVQIGNDRSATMYLRQLDDEIGNPANGIRDIVDTTPYIGEVSPDMIVKIMLGGINRREDKKRIEDL